MGKNKKKRNDWYYERDPEIDENVIRLLLSGPTVYCTHTGTKLLPFNKCIICGKTPML